MADEPAPRVTPDRTEVLAVLWEYTEDHECAGSRFWGCHSVGGDGRTRDWPTQGMRALGAARITVTEGEGLDLLHNVSDAQPPKRDDSIGGWGNVTASAPKSPPPPKPRR